MSTQLEQEWKVTHGQSLHEGWLANWGQLLAIHSNFQKRDGISYESGKIWLEFLNRWPPDLGTDEQLAVIADFKVLCIAVMVEFG